MSRDDFKRRFRFELLGIMAECYVARKAAPSELGQLMDAHQHRVALLLGEMYDALKPTTNPALDTPLPGTLPKPAATNGHAPTTATKRP